MKEGTRRMDARASFPIRHQYKTSHDLAKVMGRLSNSPPPKSAQFQGKGLEKACEWPIWATVEISLPRRLAIDRRDEKQDTLLTRWSPSLNLAVKKDLIQATAVFV